MKLMKQASAYEYFKNSNKYKQWKKEEEDMEGKNQSTLALHIASYENGNESADPVSTSSSQQTRFKKSKMEKVFCGAGENPFEFSRSNKENGSCKPEIMGFKASQRLLNPNDIPSASNGATTTAVAATSNTAVADAAASNLLFF
uniref:Uncharacterized protein n=1 Tax=Panagrolaimus sp. ES5 TaxID=591445 RepID=A0AC34G985_9BILA